MLSPHKQLQEARTPHDEIALQRQIEATDRQIDGRVFELYGLTEEEIKIGSSLFSMGEFESQILCILLPLWRNAML